MCDGFICVYRNAGFCDENSCEHNCKHNNNCRSCEYAVVELTANEYTIVDCQLKLTKWLITRDYDGGKHNC